LFAASILLCRFHKGFSAESSIGEHGFDGKIGMIAVKSGYKIKGYFLLARIGRIRCRRLWPV
jgi:hypothetical protein